MLLVGLAFKVSAAPFHMWTPDVYQGAPTPVTAFMSAATKVAGARPDAARPDHRLSGEEELWTIALAVIACISLAWGNLAALVQTDVKRLLAYSSISHAGFLLMPIAAGNALGGRALLYYLIPYAAHEHRRVRRRRRPRAGAGSAGHVSRPWPASAGSGPSTAIAMAIFMFGFIGLPPAGLFLGKFYAFSARRPRLGLARDRRRRRHGRLDLLLPRRRPGDVHAAPAGFASRPRAARRRATPRSTPRSRPRSSSPSGASSPPAR